MQQLLPLLGGLQFQALTLTLTLLTLTQELQQEKQDKRHTGQQRMEDHQDAMQALQGQLDRVLGRDEEDGEQSSSQQIELTQLIAEVSLHLPCLK